jgi:hypothetical protein
VARFGDAAATWLFSSEEVNAVSPVIETKDGFVVFKRTGTRKAIERSFEQVKNQIKNVVYREKRTNAFNAFVDELRARYQVKTFPEKLDQLKVEVNPAALPATGGDAHGHPMPGQLMPVHDDDDDDDGAPSGPPSPG